jgi:hypothetical protein
LGAVTFKILARARRDASPRRPAALVLRISGADLSDAQFAKLTATNSILAGLAPGFSEAGGEKLDVIKPLEDNDRLMVKRYRGQAAPRPIRALAETDKTRIPNVAILGSGRVTPLGVRDAAALVLPPAR